MIQSLLFSSIVFTIYIFINVITVNNTTNIKMKIVANVTFKFEKQLWQIHKLQIN